MSLWGPRILHVCLWSCHNQKGPCPSSSARSFVPSQECARYGKVEECVIFELLDTTVPESEAVRIFVRFATRAGAAAAVADLDGRFFDGRAVRAAYWNEDKFERRELM